MDRKLIFTLLLFSHTVCSFAQWTKEDSVWLEGVASGKIKLELNPETQKAIEEGMFISTDKPIIQPLHAPNTLPITKVFTDIKPANVPPPESDSIDFSRLPPSVFMKYELKVAVRSVVLIPIPPLKKLDSVRIGNTGAAVRAKATNVYPSAVKDGQRRGGFVASVGYSFSADDLLRTIFQPSFRAKKRNKKHATAWKNYNSTP